MILKQLSKTLGYITIITLNAILCLSLASNSKIIGHSLYFDLLVNAMYVALIASSIMLGKVCWARQKTWSLLFYFNIIIVIVPSLLKQAGMIQFGSTFLLGLDLYWLNLYLVYLYRFKNDSV